MEELQWLTSSCSIWAVVIRLRLSAKIDLKEENVLSTSTDIRGACLKQAQRSGGKLARFLGHFPTQSLVDCCDDGDQDFY